MPLTITRPRERTHRRHQLVPWVALTAALLGLLSLIVPRLDNLHRERVVFRNDTDWAIDVSLVLDNGTSRVALATLMPHQTTALTEVAAPGGERWTFEFSFGPRRAQATETDAALRRPDAAITVPGELTRALEAADEPPTPT